MNLIALLEINTAIEEAGHAAEKVPPAAKAQLLQALPYLRNAARLVARPPEDHVPSAR